MSFKLGKATDYFLFDTQVENIFINEYMVSAPGDYVKVYLFALMYAKLGSDFTNEDIAKQLGLDHEDVLKAWTYWEKIGVVKKHWDDPQDKFNYDIEFLVLKQQLYGEKGGSGLPAIGSGIDAAMGDEEVKSMFSDVEKCLGRILSSTEATEIISWITDFNASPEIIAYAFEYCVSKGKNSIKYVEAVVKNWASEGLQTVIDVEKMLSEIDKKQHLYKRVFDALGFRRNATEEEKRLMNTWFNDMGFSLDTVLRACGKTAGISNPNMNYVNKVLQNWLEEGEKKQVSADAPSTSEIMEYYDLLRKKEQKEADRRRAKVLGSVPRIKEIDEEVIRLNTEVSKIIISNRIDKKEATLKIQEKMDSLNAERAFLLTDNGFEIDYMDVRYNCPKCKDTGILETGERCQCFGEITKEKIRQLKMEIRK